MTDIWSRDVPIDMLREELIGKMVEHTGMDRAEYRTVLKLLGHPDLVKATVAYFQALDTDMRCRNYEPPWSCIREAEARYENKTQGWLGGPVGGLLDQGFSEWWCDSCRGRILE